MLPTVLVKRKIAWNEKSGAAYFSIARRRFIRAEAVRAASFIYYLTPGIYLYFSIYRANWSYVNVSYHKVFPDSSADVEGDTGVFVFRDPESIPEKIASDFAKWGYPPKPNTSPYEERDVLSLLRFVKKKGYWKEQGPLMD